MVSYISCIFLILVGSLVCTRFYSYYHLGVLQIFQISYFVFDIWNLEVGSIVSDFGANFNYIFLSLFVCLSHLLASMT